MANRLQNENSPYLQKFQKSAVEWWPWCEAAFEQALRENKAIFVSIGFSACQLCDFMDEDVFEESESVEILNSSFIAIKVDRDEHPDIDRYFQEAYQLLNRTSGGWPLNLFLTPQKKVFLARTYMSAQSRDRSNEGMGFVELAKLVATKIEQKNERLYEDAKELENILTKIEHPTEATRLSESFRKNFLLQVSNNFDKEHGGFGEKPKFAHASTLNALLNIENYYSDESAKNMLIQTLNAIKDGALYDSAHGGFYRHTTDEKWMEAKPEKMLYDNAELISLYARSYLAFKDESYLESAKKSADFWLTQMSEDGLFYSSLSPNTQSSEATPIKDAQIQTAWSSMMVTALLALGSIDDKYKEHGLKSLDRLMEHLFVGEQLYHCRTLGKEPTVKAFLEDYAFMTEAYLAAFEATLDEIYLINAQRFANKALEEFYEMGRWSFSTQEFHTKAEIKDTHYTSSVSVMVANLLTLGVLLEDEKYTHFAFKTLEYNSYELGRKPLHMPHLFLQSLRYLKEIEGFKTF